MSEQNKKTVGARIKRVFRNHASEFSIGSALLVICIVLTCLSPFFLQMRNIKNILSYVSIAGTMSAGLTVVMLMGCMDLSQYSVMAMIGMIEASMLKAGLNPYLAILASILMGACVGSITGFIVTKMRIVPIIATIGMQLIARAVAYLSTNGIYIMVDNPVFYSIGYEEIAGLPYLVWVLLIVNIVLSFILSNTAFGRKIYAVGGNAQACALSGISVDKMKMMGYIISGITAGIAAVLCTAQVSAAYPTAGNGQEMDCSAAVYLGGLAVGGGKGSILGTFIGVVLIAVLLNGMTLLSINAYYQVLFKGLVLIVAVYIDQVRQMRAPKKAHVS
ncbi:MAG: ABC transporter permease [Clostridia bacterium]|nr:ABC transporter permease [Clostridia bacterium]